MGTRKNHKKDDASEEAESSRQNEKEKNTVTINSFQIF